MSNIHLVLCLSLILTCMAVPQKPGYSYHQFTGPVSGDIQRVSFSSPHSGPSIDYIARPDYKFVYGVEDEQTGNNQKHEEQRQGATVHGQYSLLQPDGSTRIVTYTADPENGFQADIKYV